MNTMQMSDAGLRALTMQFEGCKLTAYPDPGTGGEPWTIGYGHTGPEVHEGMTITQDEAEVLLHHDIAGAESSVNALVKVDLTQHQFDALVDFTYNVGSGNFHKSTLLMLLNDGNASQASEQFAVWNKAAGTVMNGLAHRRAAETAWFNTND